jgi:hypothetical protein
MLSGLERVNQLALSATLCAVGVVGLGILLAPSWGLSGVAFAMAASKLFTFWPIQVYEARRILRRSNVEIAVREGQFIPSDATSLQCDPDSRINAG